jgi:hypothetical protein
MESAKGIFNAAIPPCRSKSKDLHLLFADHFAVFQYNWFGSEVRGMVHASAIWDQTINAACDNSGNRPTTRSLNAIRSK